MHATVPPGLSQNNLRRSNVTILRVDTPVTWKWSWWLIEDWSYRCTHS